MMTIVCLAIVGKNNEPLYFCDCEFGEKDADGDKSSKDSEDMFGFSEQENSLSLDKEVRCYCRLANFWLYFSLNN